MKKIFFLLTYSVCLTLFSSSSEAQRVSVRLDFPIGTAVNPPGPPPFRGAIWIGPEWRWHQGSYVIVPGYWSRPKGRHRHWNKGHWKHTRHGYCWTPGRWR